MTVTWLGQAGLLFQSEKTTILVDPYFSDSAASVAMHRRMHVDPSVWEIKPDLLLCTHDHIDHYDPETIPHFVNADTTVTVLSPFSVWDKLRYARGRNNFVQVIPGVVWTHRDVIITTVGAVHSDPYAVGYLLECEGKTYYITGDTLYCPSMLDELPNGIDVVFLPINGKGNNMNAADAVKFADYIGATISIPIHFGMLDDMDPSVFQRKNTILPEIYKEMTL